MKEYLEYLTKHLSVRFSKRQKQNAAAWISDEMEKQGYLCETIRHKKYFTSVRNIVAGNLKQAKTIIVVPYDTPSRVFWHKFLYYPLDGNLSARKSLFPMYVPIFLLYFLMLALMYGIPYFMPTPEAVSAAYIAGIVLLVLIVALLAKGIPTRKNAIYHAGVAAALELAASLEKEQKRNVAFVFTDQNSGKFYGAYYVRLRLDELKKSAQVITLNGVGAGGELVIGYTKGQKKNAQELIKAAGKHHRVASKSMDSEMLVQSAMQYFPKGIVVASGVYDEKHNLYIDRLRRNHDDQVDEKQLEVIVSMLKNNQK